MITGRTHLYAVIGQPIAHSRSPELQNAAFAAAGIDAAYLALPVAPERLPEALRGAHALGFRGLNVTVPHKQAAAEQCVELEETARLCGAANTLLRAEAGWRGANTDAPACRDLLRAAGIGTGARSLLLGAGGAALAGAWALLAAGADVTVAARRPEAAKALCDRLGAAFSGGPRPRAASWNAAADLAAGSDVVVNATSIGLGGQGRGAAPVPVRRGQVVVDFVYGDTSLARAARAAGASLVTGEELLVRQGALAFTLWTGQPAPEATMAAALAPGRA
ncbi:MAG TPA: shikimate dehydrogenase (NADP+) [Anaeromyxobacteraceae bacterium]|nr:shikimate dehydrogenase (NADP+) [Anaeromyxobacteraceae bacterium]